MLKRLNGSTLIISVAALLAVASSARADTYTYKYVGYQFSTWFDSGCPPECNVTGEMTFANPIPSNLSWPTSLFSVDPPLSFSFTDGLNTYTSANANFEDLYGLAPCNSIPCVSTGPYQNIEYWGFALVDTAGLELVSLAVLRSNGLILGHDLVVINSPFGLNAQAASDSPGMWSGPFQNQSPTPEPVTLFLVSTGLIGVLGVSRRKGRT